VPAVADAATITWSLQKKVGDTLSYTDEQGRPFEVRLVAAIAPSMLQGGLFVSERALLAHFPSVSGYRMFLVDVDPPSDETRAAEALMRGFQREGLSLVPATERLGEFFAVNNTYVSIFQVLGGLGMVLGSVGLGLVVLRNVLERRGELALLRAVGFRRSELRRLVLWEHWGLLLAGLVIGAAAAGVAVLPALGTSGRGLPMVSLGLTLAGILASGLLWTHLAAAAALRGPLLDALRNE
jgi:predicted lysophospholipase L1 biosynthesis ABC-type transport system permease subunit